ncbi:PilX N-terminal domain-containing pilus assembly protein [Microbulbifer aggregans]|uniref:pilus assembly PilX family protein n=1 Tax=Microbulbifer aggregans TaxID=1769779 RepID=UPI001CFF010F|nr:PilX N-terminal domain-containing pilus assembly protein [Microbulbifer aggregans]
MKAINNQRGAVLIVSLVILLVLTLIGVSGARSALMGERMTFASRDAKIALEVAESMARLGEAHIDSLDNLNAFTTTGWLRSEGNGPDDLFAAATWTNDNSVEKDVPMLAADGTTKLKGRMYIELAGLASDDANPADVDLSTGSTGLDFPDIRVFKIVTRGKGIGGTERVIVTLYGRSI